MWENQTITLDPVVLRQSGIICTKLTEVDSKVWYYGDWLCPVNVFMLYENPTATLAFIVWCQWDWICQSHKEVVSEVGQKVERLYPCIHIFVG